MDLDYIILKTMARFSISYSQAKMIVHDLEQREELEGYVAHIDDFPTYYDLRKYYYGTEY